MSGVAVVEVRGRDGEMATVVDPDAPAPAHHPLCDGAGFLRSLEPEDAAPVLCRVCRPVAAAARERADRLAAIGRPRRLGR